MDSEDPLFILYTSSSTGKPKGVVHTCGGYMVYTCFSFKNVFQYQRGDVYWCTADIGWITGHSYIIYGPLLAGATTMMFEVVPTYPDAGRFWAICEKYKVNQFYTAPTTIRALMAKGDSFVEKYDLSSIKVLGSVGEPINEEAWNWYNEKVGLLCIKHPCPSIIRTTYGNHERCRQVYFSTFEDKYFTGDGARRDADGRYRIIGRVDDVINVSGHRMGTAKVENAINEHPKVIESAVVGYPHEIKGQGIYAYVITSGVEDIAAFEKELRAVVTREIGPIAKPDAIQVVEGLPKTRSGKIMRRILRKIASGDMDNLGDISTLLNPDIVEAVKNGVKKR